MSFAPLWAERAGLSLSSLLPGGWARRGAEHSARGGPGLLPPGPWGEQELCCSQKRDRADRTSVRAGGRPPRGTQPTSHGLWLSRGCLAASSQRRCWGLWACRGSRDGPGTGSLRRPCPHRTARVSPMCCQSGPWAQLPQAVVEGNLNQQAALLSFLK